MIEKITQQECKETAKRISKTIEDILPEKTEFYKEFELEINQINETYMGLFGRIKKVCRDKCIREHERFQKKFLELQKENITYLKEILEETKDYTKITSEKLENIKSNLENENENHKKQVKSWNDSNIYEILFQYREFVETETKPYLEANSNEIISFGGPLSDLLDNLVKYSSSSHVKPIAKSLIKKMGKVYNINASREIKGNRQIAWPSMSGHVSTTSQCEKYIREIGRNLGLSEKEAFSFAGIKGKYNDLLKYKNQQKIVRIC